MRRFSFITFILMAFLIASCNKDKNLSLVGGKAIVGKWIHVEEFASTGEPGSWRPANDGGYLTVEAGGKYTSYPDTDMLGTENQVNLVNDSTLTMFVTIVANGISEKVDITRNGNFRMAGDGSTFMLWRQCIEGCGSKFKRVANN